MDGVPAPLSVTIGESVWDLRQRAPALVRPDRMADNGPVLVTRLAEMTVVAGKRALPLPPTRFAQIEQVAGVVTAIRLAPLANYARLEPAHGLMLWLVKHAAAHGWDVAERRPVELDALRTELAKAKRLPVRKVCAVLERGPVRLHVVLEESRILPQDMTPPSPEPLFLVRTDFTDKALAEVQRTPLFAKRKALTGGTMSVPLSAWAG